MPRIGTRGRYVVAGRAAVTAGGSANLCGAALWNPHATKSIYVTGIFHSVVVGGTALYVTHTTSRGTPGSTVTPDIDNDLDRLLAPISGAVLDLAQFSVVPGRSSPEVARFKHDQNNPGPFMELWFGDGIEVGAGEGLGLFGHNTNTYQTEVSFTWDE